MTRVLNVAVTVFGWALGLTPILFPVVKKVFA